MARMKAGMAARADRATRHHRARRGFTLLEMLITVAIIAVLVAIAIPVFGGVLARARLATDQANVRSAKAAAAAEYMSDGASGSQTYLFDGGKAIPVTSGNLPTLSTITSKTGYGKSEASANAGGETGASGTPKDGYVEVTVDGSAGGASSQQISAQWTSGSIVFDPGSGTLTLTGKVLSNATIMDEIRSSGLDPSSVRQIVAARGSTIDTDTERVFAGLTGLQKVDLSGATLVHSSQYMFSDMPSGVSEIVLPRCGSDYNIAGVWYYADGSREGAKWSDGLTADTGTRIEKGHDGQTIYKSRPSGGAGA